MTRRLNFTAAGVALLVLGLTGPAGAATISTLFNTGVDSSHVALPDGAADPHYALVSAPTGANTDLVTGKASSGHYPVHGTYQPGDNSTSDWIGPNSNAVVGGLHQYFLGPAGTYDYQTTFSLNGFNPSTASIAGLWSSDNNGVEILLNGVDVGAAMTTNQFLHGFASFDITSGFIAGTNTLDFIIFNTPNPTPINPTALRVEMTGTATPSATGIPEPASLLVFGTFGALGFVGYGWRRRKEAE